MLKNKTKRNQRKMKRMINLKTKELNKLLYKRIHRMRRNKDILKQIDDEINKSNNIQEYIKQQEDILRRLNTDASLKKEIKDR